MIPIDKSGTPSNYYRINSNKKIKFSTKLLRFITRYLIPTLIVAGVIVVSDIFIFNKSYYDTTDMLTLIGMVSVIGFLSVVLCNLWFLLITRNQDEK